MVFPDKAFVRFSQLGKAFFSRSGALTILFGYFAQAYGAVVAILFAPYVLNALGSEAYGLVGVFLLLQAWFQLLDSGLTPAVTRETARFRGGAVSAASVKTTLQGLETVILLSSLPIILLSWAISNRVAQSWLQSESLSVTDIKVAFQLMILIIVVRWMSGVKRGLLVGFERHTALYSTNIGVATLRYPCIFLFFFWFPATSTYFFIYQLGISILEALLLWGLCVNLLPGDQRAGMFESIKSLRRIAKFAINHGFLALLWILISQTDKLLLSGFLSLSHFGYFTLAASAAYGVNLVVLPIGQFLMPRLSRLNAGSDAMAVVSTYRRLTRVAVVSVSGITVVFVCFPQQVLMSWTNNADIARIAEPVLAWYALGNAAMAISGFSYYLQYARGKLRLHTIGTLGFLIVIVPALYTSVNLFGLAGASITWAGFWVLYLLTWITITHRLILQSLHWHWLFFDVLVIFVPVLMLGLLCRQWLVLPEGRVSILLILFAFWVLSSMLAVVLSRLVPFKRLYQRISS